MKIKRRKQIKFGILGVVTMITPLAITVSCDKGGGGLDDGGGSNPLPGFLDEKVTDVSDDIIVRPFDYSDIKRYGKDQPMFYRGLGFHSHVHGMSFLYNIARKLGFKMFSGEGVVKGGGNSDKARAQELINHMQLAKNKAASTQHANPKDSAEVWLDALGSDGSMGLHQFYMSGVDTTMVQDRYGGSGERVVTINGKNISYEVGMGKFFQFIDGNNPGSVFLKIRASTGSSKFDFSFKSHTSFYRTFKAIDKAKSDEAEKLKEIQLLYFIVFKNLNHAFNHGLFEKLKSAGDGYLHKKIFDFFKFIKNLNVPDPNNATLNIDGGKLIDFEKGVINQELKDAIEELATNGSHDLFAVEIFARGVNNVPKAFLPGTSSYLENFKYDERNMSNLVGIANMKSFYDLTSWSRGTLANNTDAKNPGLDPETMETFDDIVERFGEAAEQEELKKTDGKNYSEEEAEKDGIKTIWSLLNNRTKFKQSWVEKMMNKLREPKRVGKILPILGGLIDKKTNEEIIDYYNTLEKSKFNIERKEAYKKELYNWLVSQATYTQFVTKGIVSDSGNTKLGAGRNDNNKPKIAEYAQWKEWIDKYYIRPAWDERNDKEKRGLGGYLQRTWKNVVALLPGTPTTGLSYGGKDLRLSIWDQVVVESSLTRGTLKTNLNGKIKGDAITEADLGIQTNISSKKYRLAIETPYDSNSGKVGVALQINSVQGKWTTIKTFIVQGRWIDKKTNDEVMTFWKSARQKKLDTDRRTAYKKELYDWLVLPKTYNEFADKKIISNSGATTFDPDDTPKSFNSWKKTMQKYYGRLAWDERHDKNKRGLSGYLQRSWSRIVLLLPGTPTTGLSYGGKDLRLSIWYDLLVESSLTKTALQTNLNGKVKGDVIPEADLGIQTNISSTKYRLVIEKAFDPATGRVVVSIQGEEDTGAQGTKKYRTIKTITVQGI